MNSSTPTQTARVLAAAIIFNGERYDRQDITRAEWHHEQMRLWNLAAEARCASAVVRLVAPSLTQGATS